MSVSLTKQARPDEEGIPGSSRYTIKPSPVHGLGVFARRQFNQGDVIGVTFVVRPDPPVVRLVRTELGRFVNYSAEPNAVAVPGDIAWLAVATRSIGPGEEIFMDYCHAYELATRLFGASWSIPKGYIKFRKWLPDHEPEPMDLPCKAALSIRYSNDG